MPVGDVYSDLARLIFQLSERYSAPNFEPHVTLLNQVVGSEEEILSKAAKLATIITPYEVQLAQVGYLDEYFRCIFLKVKQTDDVMNANARARKEFQGYIKSSGSAKEYIPHLSLLYGNFPSRIKEEITTEIGQKWKKSFQIDSIHLFLTAGEVKKWYRVKEFPLGE